MGEIPEEKDFFEVSKKSESVVCHFYTDGNERCKIVDKHLGILAKKHLEAKFVKINAEKCPFLTERLRIKVIPTIMLVKDSKTRDYIVGFTDLGNHDEFSTEMMEWRIATAGLIEYSGDLMTPPDAAKDASKKKKTTILGKGIKAKTIRQGGKGNRDDDDSSDEDDWLGLDARRFKIPKSHTHIANNITASLSHLRTMLPKSSSCPKPAQ